MCDHRTVFGLLTLVHIWRAFVEPHLAKDPWFVRISLIAAQIVDWVAHASRVLVAVSRCNGLGWRSTVAAC